MPKFNLCIVEGKCHYKVWGFHSSFIRTIAEACLGLMDYLTKVPFPVFFFFFNLPGHPSLGFSHYYFNGRWWEVATQEFPFFLPYVIVSECSVMCSPFLYTYKGFTKCTCSVHNKSLIWALFCFFTRLCGLLID